MRVRASVKASYY